MPDPIEEPDEMASRALDVLCEAAEGLIHERRYPPGLVAKAAVAAALMLFRRYNVEGELAGCAYMRKFADSVEAQAPKSDPTPRTLN